MKYTTIILIWLLHIGQAVAVQGDTFICSPLLEDVIAGRNIVINVNCDVDDTANNEEVQACLAARKTIVTSCKARDKSGFHSSPNGKCDMSLTAPAGHFFAHKSVFVLEEHYRKLDGLSAVLAMKPGFSTINGKRRVTSFGGQIRCTNNAGTGRTCEASAKVAGMAFPNRCSKYVTAILDEI